MKAPIFARNTSELLVPGAMVPPLVGRIGNLRIAAGVIRADNVAERPSGVVLLANDHENGERGEHPDNTCYRYQGRASLGRNIDTPSSPWTVEVEVATSRVVSLAGQVAARALFEDAYVRLTETGFMLGTLTVRHFGRIESATVNGIPFDAVGWPPVADLT